MTLEGVPGVSQTMMKFVQTVRLYIRDHPELNRLIAGEESSDRQILWAILDAIEDFNGTPHITHYTLEDLLARRQRSLLLRMTVVALVESVGLLQTRNHINYVTGGTQVGINDKTPMLMAWLQYFKATTEQMKQRVKVSINISDAMGTSVSGVPSEYWAVHSLYITIR